jgi:hypothetical protein
MRSLTSRSSTSRVYRRRHVTGHLSPLAVAAHTITGRPPGATGRACIETLEDGRLMSFSPAASYAVGKTITVTVKGDKLREANETFFVDLFGPSSNALIAIRRGIGTILNDD